MLGTRDFKGMFPRISPRNLPTGAAQAAIDVWLDRGYPRPIAELEAVAGVPQFPAATRTIYRFDTDRWFAWDHDVHVARAPVVEDTTRRTIWTGDEYPRHTSTTIMQGSAFVSPGVPVSRRLGIPAPDAEFPPMVARVAGGGFVADGDIRETHAYVYTFLSDLDEEGPPSNPSATVERAFDAEGNIQAVNIDTPVSLQGAYGVNRKRIYRTATGTTGTSYRLLATIPLTQARYVDTTQTAALGDLLPSLDWDPPPDDLDGLIALPNGVLAGFLDRDVYFSVPYQPHAWPRDFIQTVDTDIVGLGNFGVNVVVGTVHKPYLISGSQPSMAAAARMEFEQPCVSKHSFATLDKQGVAFASPDGLVLVGPGGGEFISREMYTRARWQALNPSEFRAVYHDGAWVGFTSERAIALSDEMTGAVETTDEVTVIYRDPEHDAIYVLDNRVLKEWKTQGPPRTMRWKSGLDTGHVRSYNAAQVIADGYPVTLKLFGDADPNEENPTPVATLTVTSKAPFRLPDTVRSYSDWEWEVSGLHGVQEVRIGLMMEMLGG